MGNKGDELQRIPGVGPAIAAKLRGIGIHSVADLRGRDPEELYRRHQRRIGRRADRCLLYVFRGAVYFAETPEPEPRLLKWWNWQDDAD
jgi:hypothetical protein